MYCVAMMFVLKYTMAIADYSSEWQCIVSSMHYKIVSKLFHVGPFIVYLVNLYVGRYNCLLKWQNMYIWYKLIFEHLKSSNMENIKFCMSIVILNFLLYTASQL